MCAALAGIDPPVKAVSPPRFPVGGIFPTWVNDGDLMKLPWFRLYTEFASDPKIQIMAFEDQRHFVMLLCLKGNGTLDTNIPNDSYRDRLIAKALGLDPASCSEAKRRLMESDLIDKNWQPKKWDDRQYVSDYSTIRVQKFRQKRKGNVSETFQKRRETVIDTDTDTDTEQRRSEGESAPRSLAHRLPPNWELTEERRAIANLANVHAERVFENFRDYHYALDGPRAVKLDWDAAWRLWVRREGQRTEDKDRPRKTRYQQLTEKLQARVNEN